MLQWTVRVVSGGEKVSMRDSQYGTKRDALRAISALGTLLYIKRMGHLYIVQANPSAKK